MKALLLARQEVSGVVNETLAAHGSLPPHFPWVWEWFLSLRPGFNWTEIDAWARRSGQHPTGWECDLLLQLDKLRMAHV